MPATIAINSEDLRPLVEEITAEVVRRMGSLGDDRIGYTEGEAAAKLGLTVTQLADERRRGRIVACRVVGDRIRYTPEQLDRYMREREDRRYIERSPSI